MFNNQPLALILLAGGESLRFNPNQTRPVQSKLLSPVTPKKTVLEFAFENLVAHLDYEQLIIVCHPDWQNQYQALLSQHPQYQASQTQWILSGPTRRDSVKNALGRLQPNILLCLVHDSARPFIEQNDKIHLLEKLVGQENGGVSLGFKATNTIKQFNDTCLNTLDRNSLWETVTPQAFYTKDLVQAHQMIPLETPITDDLQLIELSKKFQTNLVETTRTNLKLSTPDDLILIQAIAANQALSLV